MSWPDTFLGSLLITRTVMGGTQISYLKKTLMRLAIWEVALGAL